MTDQLTPEVTTQQNQFVGGFIAMSEFIRKHGDLTDWKPKTLPKKEVDTTALGKLLPNAWSAEYALRITPVVNDEQYLQSSLHWVFPQIFYSVLFSARAFMLAQGINVSNEDLIRKRIASTVYRGFYPESLNYFASGPLIKMGRNIRIRDKQIAKALESAREQQLDKQWREWQSNPKLQLRRPAGGEPLKQPSSDQAESLSDLLSHTSYFDILARLRISSTNRDVEALTGVEFDVKGFHTHLTRIAEHVNGVHETYVASAIGIDAYKELVRKAPSYLKESFVRDRMNQIVLPKINL